MKDFPSLTNWLDLGPPSFTATKRPGSIEATPTCHKLLIYRSPATCQARQNRMRATLMALLMELLDRPSKLPASSKYTIANGILYLASGVLMMTWPGSVQTFFLEQAFVGNEAGLFRVIGLTLAIIGWFYIFGGRTSARSFVAATIVDRLFLPLVLVPLAIDGVFPHVALTFAIVDPALAIGAWALLRRRKPVSLSASLRPLN